MIPFQRVQIVWSDTLYLKLSALNYRFLATKKVLHLILGYMSTYVLIKKLNPANSEFKRNYEFFVSKAFSINSNLAQDWTRHLVNV